MHNNYKIAILGDSFAADRDQHSWITLLEQSYHVENLSVRGSSQYRLYRLFRKNLQKLQQSDLVVFFHTNPDRVYLPDGIDFASRRLPSHTQCDLVANNALQDPELDHIFKIYYRYFFDAELQQVFYELMIADMQKNLASAKILNCSGFAVTHDSVPIKSFARAQQDHPGNVNHFDQSGNMVVYKYVLDEISK